MLNKLLDKRVELMALALITAIAALARFYDLPHLPPGLNYDESAKGVLAELSLQTGEWKVFYAANFGTEPLATWAAGLIIVIFGKTPWLLRLAPALVGTLTIPATWWMARELLAGRVGLPSQDTIEPSKDAFAPLLALGSALILALQFWHLNFSRIAMEPIWSPLLLTLTVAAIARALNTSKWGDYALAGFLTAGSFYTYKAGYFAPFLAAALIGYHALRERGYLRANLRNLAVYAAVALTVIAPLGWYFATHSEEFLARPMAVSVNTSMEGPGGINFAENAVKVLKMYFIEGDNNQRSNLPGRPALDPLMAILFVIGIGRSLAGWRSPRELLPFLWLVLLSVPTLITELAPHFGRAIGVTPVLALLGVWGAITLWQLAARAPVRWAGAAAGAVVIAVSVISSGIALNDYFVVMAHQSSLYYAYDTAFLDVADYASTRPSDELIYLTPDQDGHFTWQYVTPRDIASYQGENGIVFPPPDTPATVIQLAGSAVATLREIRGYRPDASISQELFDPDNNQVARALYIPASSSPAPDPQVMVNARIGDQIELVGYSLSTSEAHPGDTIVITLTWRVLAHIEADYTVFTHMLNSDSSLLTGHDGLPIGGSYPTLVWRPGETILDRHVIEIPSDAPAGDYQLSTGMYLLETLERVQAVDSQGKSLPGNVIVLGLLNVTLP